MGITCITVKIETIGTDKVTQKSSKGKREPAGNWHFLEGSSKIRTKKREF